MPIEFYNHADDSSYIAGGTYIEAIGEAPGKGGTWSLTGTQNEHTRTIEIVTKDAAYGDIIVGKALKYYGIYPGNTYQIVETGEQDLSCRCLSVSVSQDTTKPTHWTASVKYGVSTWSGGVKDGGDVSNPLDQIPIPVFVRDPFETPMVYDVNGDPVLNSAGDRFSPPQTQAVRRKVMIYERNEADFAEALADQFRNKVNDDVWNGYAAKIVCCRDITGTPQFHPIVGIYYKVQYEFEFWDGGITGPDVATRWVLDAGWNEVVGTDKLPIVNDDLSIPGDIPLLDGSGGRLASGGTPVYIDVEHRETADFSLLNITLI